MFKHVWVGVFVLFSVLGCSEQKLNSKPAISIWHWMTDRDATFQELAKKYEILTGVKINFELYAPSDAYTQKIRAAAQGMNLPDVFGILGEKRDFASFQKVLDSVISYLASSRPTARNLFWGLERMRRAAMEHQDTPVEDIKKILFKEAQEIIEEDRRVCRMILENGKWMIASVRNLKEVVEFQNEMSLP